MNPAPRPNPHRRTNLEPVDESDRSSGTSIALGLLLRRINKLITLDIEEEVLRPHGFTWATYRVCLTLWIDGPLEPHAVATATSMSRAGVTLAMKALIAEGDLVTSPSPSDGRSIIMELTPAGVERTDRAHQGLGHVTDEWLAPLDEPDRLVLMGLLSKLLIGPRAQRFPADQAITY